MLYFIYVAPKISMNLKNLKIKKCYNSDSDNPLTQFYIPVLSTAKHYKRITGSFTSGILSKAAHGIAGLVANGGKMQLIVGVQITEGDYEAMKNATVNPERYISDLILKEIGEIENFLSKDHTEALAWMLANDILEIKIGLVPPGNLSHMKVGIIKDMDGNKLSFSGSNNETPSGWEHNVEEFKVFCEWKHEEKAYFEDDEYKFNELWEGNAKRAIVVNLPDAIKEGIIKTFKSGTVPRLFKDKKNFTSEGAMQHAFKVAQERMEKRASISGEKKSRDINLHRHQKDAVSSWIKNDKRGILEMATGTGKTFTAIACIDKLWRESSVPIVIAIPYNHLISQWKKEFLKLAEDGSLEDFTEIHKVTKGNILITGSANPKWKKEFINFVLDFNGGTLDKLVILTTHDTVSSENFIAGIEKLKTAPLIIIDEVHGIGTLERKAALLGKYKYRLALSATPKRWMDDEGSKIINDYFEKTVFEFSLEKAINTINPITGKTYLTPYNYFPLFVELTDDEMVQYREITKEISKLSNFKDHSQNTESRYARLLMKRANIIKSARNKLTELKEVIQDIKKDNEDLDYTLIYCNPGEQFEEVLEMLNDERIPHHKFTNKEDVKESKKYGGKSERDFILERFSEKNIKVLVAIKCLDEGVDIPPAQYGVLLASSTNPKEYIQRRGRLLRNHKGKKMANIYDMVVIPPLSDSKEDTRLDKAIYMKELKRYREFAGIAKNSADCLLKIIAKEEELGFFK